MLRIVYAIHHPISSPCGSCVVGYPMRGSMRYNHHVRLPVLTWIIHCVDHSSSIWSVRSMVMHQQGGLLWLRLPSHPTLVPLVPIITCPAVRPISTCSYTLAFCP